MSIAEDRQRLEVINQILANGATESSGPDGTTKWNFTELRRERFAIEVRLGIRPRRRRVFGFNMGSH